MKKDKITKEATGAASSGAYQAPMGKPVKRKNKSVAEQDVDDEMEVTISEAKFNELVNNVLLEKYVFEEGKKLFSQENPMNKKKTSPKREEPKTITAPKKSKPVVSGVVPNKATLEDEAEKSDTVLDTAMSAEGSGDAGAMGEGLKKYKLKGNILVTESKDLEYLLEKYQKHLKGKTFFLEDFRGNVTKIDWKKSKAEVVSTRNFIKEKKDTEKMKTLMEGVAPQAKAKVNESVFFKNFIKKTK